MKRKVVSVLMCASLVAAMLIGCGSSGSGESSGDDAGSAKTETESESESTSDEGGESKSYKIGFAQCTLASPFYTEMKTAAEEYAKELGVEIQVVSADDDVQKQNNDITDLVNSGIDALIVNPINTEGVAAGIQACNDADIPVITVDRMVSDGATAAVVRDNKVMGRTAGEGLLEALGGAENAKGVILEIQGTSGDQVMMDRRDGFEEVFKDVKGIEIVQSAYCDYTRSKAVTATQDLITANDNIVAIYGHNDDMAVGALQACEEAGLTDVQVCGVDGLMEAVKLIADGKYCCTSLNDPAKELRMALDAAVAILDGEELEATIDAGTGLVNADNAADYVDDSISFAGAE